MSTPLNGLRIIDLTRVLAGPLATMVLADLGADVVKIERPGRGDDTRRWGPPFQNGESAYFLGINRNKRSVTLDLGSDAGREILGRLLTDADAVIDNFKLGTLERWGFDDAWFDEHAPQVVRSSIGGYGSTGPKAGAPGYDFILQAESGLMSITGETDGRPMKMGVPMVDICTGLLTAISVLGGLQSRGADGRGRRAEVTLHDTSLMMLANVASNFLISETMPERYGNGHPNIVPYTSYAAADGEIAVSVGNDEQFRKFADLLGHAEWADDPRFETNAQRIEHREAIDALINEVVGREPREHWIRELAGVGIASGPINTVDEALTSPQAIGRGMVVDVEHPETGAFKVLASAIRFGPEPAEIRLPPPLLGEHTEEVLVGELGLGREEFERFRATGTI